MTIHVAQRKLGKLIIALRKRCRLGVKALARKSHVQKKHILRIECGIIPTKDVVNRVLNALEVKDLSLLSQVQECMNIIWPVRGPVFRSALV